MNSQQQACNLDFFAASTSQNILSAIGEKVKNGTVSSNDVENLTSKALGVLQEQGVYALFLFLLARSGKEKNKSGMKSEEYVACKIVADLLNLLNIEELNALSIVYPEENLAPEKINARKKTVYEGKPGILEHLSRKDGLLNDLNKLMLVRDLYEQTLIYTRYGAKARKEG